MAPVTQHGADRGRVGHGEGAGGARHPRSLAAPGQAVHRGELRRAAGDAPRVGAVRPREGVVHRRGGAAARAGSRSRTAGRSSSTRSGKCRPRRRSSCSGCSRSGSSTGSAGPRRSRWTCASSTATNRTLKDEVMAGEVRADLYYRLNVLSIYLPAAPGAAQRHPAAGAAVHPRVQQAARPPVPRDRAGGAADPGGRAVAGERAPAPEPDRVDGGAGADVRDPAGGHPARDPRAGARAAAAGQGAGRRARGGGAGADLHRAVAPRSPAPGRGPAAAAGRASAAGGGDRGAARGGRRRGRGLGAGRAGRDRAARARVRRRDRCSTSPG